MGFEPEAIAIAYDKTVIATGGPKIRYTDGILKRWHSEGLLTAKQVLDSEGNRSKKSMKAGADLSGQNHGKPNQQDIERMTRILKKIKEE